MTILVPALGLAILLFTLNWLFSPTAVDAEKALPYECGFSPVVGDSGAAFPVAFYLVGLLFMLFDLEILLLYPFAVAGAGWSLLEAAGMAAAFSLFGVGFVYEIRTGGLEFAGNGV